MNLGDKLIINAAITGCVLSKEDHPDLPVTLEEIAADARRVCDAGASILHLHARDDQGAPTHDPGIYSQIVARLRQLCPEAILCVSLSGRFDGAASRRALPLKAAPDMASLTLGSMNFPLEVNQNPPALIAELARSIYEAGAIPELEVFEAGFIHYANFLIMKGVLHPPYYFNLILGSLGGAPLDLIGLGHMVTMLPTGSTWAAAGIGRYQLPANVMAMSAGGHVRVGLEDNVYYDLNRKEKADNARLVDRVVRIARELGREPATGAEARRIIGLPLRE